MDTVERSAGRRGWIVLLYFSLAALGGLGFVLVGVTTFLFGAKAVLVPQLGLPASSYEGYLSADGYLPPLDEVSRSAEEETRAARERAIDDRRNGGFDDMLSGVILAGVGAPVLIWHLRRARRARETPEHPKPSGP